MDIDIIGKLNYWSLFTYTNLFGLFPGRLKYDELGKSTHLTFWISVPKVVEVVP